MPALAGSRLGEFKSGSGASPVGPSHDCASVTAAAAVTARIEVMLLWNPAQLERLGDVLADRLLYVVHGLLGRQKSLRDRIVEEGLASLLKVGDLRHIEL